MKKILIPFLVLILTACGSARVKSLTLHIDDGDVVPQYYSEADLEILPDYKNKTLEVNYSLLYPNRTEDTPELDVRTSGTVGADFFDRFEVLVKQAKSTESEEFTTGVDGTGDTAGNNFIINLNGETKIDSYWLHDDLEDFRSFYLDVVKILTEEEQV